MSTTPAVSSQELKPGFTNIQSENTVEAFVSQDYKYGFYTGYFHNRLLAGSA